MNKRVISFIFVFIISLSLITFFTTRSLSKSPTENTLENCNTLVYNGEGKTNVVFLSPEENAENYIKAFFEISPFNKNKENFNFYSIDYSPECELYKGIAVLCYSKDVVKTAGSCPSDYIVALKDLPANIRSSTYMNIISLNLNNNLNVFSHEFGHAFANLADEYIPAKIPKGSKNCKKTCDEFNGVGDCVSGCSEEGYYRSINSGIMKTLSSNSFGLFNENIISEKIQKSSKITGSVIENTRNCENEKYYLIEGKLENGKISIISKTIEIGCIGENGVGVFSYNLILENGEKTNLGEFNPELIFTDVGENILSGGAENYSGNFILRVPIINNADKLEIVNEEDKLELSLKDIGARPCLI